MTDKGNEHWGRDCGRVRAVIHCCIATGNQVDRVTVLAGVKRSGQFKEGGNFVQKLGEFLVAKGGTDMLIHSYG